MNAALNAHALSFSYPGVKVLNELNASFPVGSRTALVGPSGCGKTTLLRCFCGLTRPDSGTLSLFGQNYVLDGELVYKGWDLRRQVMLVPQSQSLLPHKTAEDNIRLGLRTVRGAQEQEITQKVHAIADRLGIATCLPRYPEELSGGQLQRVQLARVAVLRPRVMLLDEVASSLDPPAQVDLVSTLADLFSRRSDPTQTIVFVTHSRDLALRIADRVAFMQDGKIVEALQTNDLADAASPALRDFLGTLPEWPSFTSRANEP